MNRYARFEVVGEITNIEVIAIRGRIREVERLRRLYGGSRWRKLKGRAVVQLADGTIEEHELHWYECHGIGRRAMKIKPPEED